MLAQASKLGKLEEQKYQRHVQACPLKESTHVQTISINYTKNSLKYMKILSTTNRIITLIYQFHTDFSLVFNVYQFYSCITGCFNLHPLCFQTNFPLVTCLRSSNGNSRLLESKQVVKIFVTGFYSEWPSEGIEALKIGLCSMYIPVSLYTKVLHYKYSLKISNVY